MEYRGDVKYLKSEPGHGIDAIVTSVYEPKKRSKFIRIVEEYVKVPALKDGGVAEATLEMVGEIHDLRYP